MLPCANESSKGPPLRQSYKHPICLHGNIKCDIAQPAKTWERGKEIALRPRSQHGCDWSGQQFDSIQDLQQEGCMYMCPQAGRRWVSRQDVDFGQRGGQHIQLGKVEAHTGIEVCIMADAVAQDIVTQENITLKGT